MRPSQNIQLAEALLPGVLAAGRCQMRHFHPEVVVERKADWSPVTVADRESELILLEALQRAAPGVPVIAEEACAAGRQARIGDSFFLVDPLDGTRQFIQQIPEFTVNIALVSDGVPVFGLIYAPAFGELFVTGDGGTAFEAQVALDDDGVRLTADRLKPLRGRVPDPAALSVIDSRSIDPARTMPILAPFGIAARRRVGSSLKFVLVARGEADVYVRPGPTAEWDTAAGQAILTAAGGCVCDLEGRELRYGHAARGFINPHFVASARPLSRPAELRESPREV